MSRNLDTLRVAAAALMKAMQASRSIASVRSGPPLPPAPAAQTTYVGDVESMMDWAWACVLISSILETRTSSFPGWFSPKDVIVDFWAGSRMTLVSCQERDRMRGVSSRDTLP